MDWTFNRLTKPEYGRIWAIYAQKTTFRCGNKRASERSVCENIFPGSSGAKGNKQMTEKLYYEDAYIKEFDAVVTAVADGGRKAAVDRTAFYPEGGGQGADTGVITVNGEAINVLVVQEEGSEIWHTLSSPVSVGDTISGRIDWDVRFDHMQQHSGEHIVSGMLCKAFACDNVGFHMGDDVITIDYNARISLEDALKIEDAANRYIWENHRTEILMPSAEELKTIPYRSKKELEGDVRIVRFPGADTCACCGTHVAMSGEIGLVKITSAHNFHDGTRIELYCGKRALEYLSMSQRANKAVAVLLSTKEEKTADVVRKQLDEFISLKAENTATEDRFFKFWAESLAGEENVLIINDWMSADQGRRLADVISDTCGGITAVFTGTDGGYRYSLISKGNDISAFVKEMNAALSGRGGGRDGFAQGSVSAAGQEIKAFFRK